MSPLPSRTAPSSPPSSSRPPTAPAPSGPPTAASTDRATDGTEPGRVIAEADAGAAEVGDELVARAGGRAGTGRANRVRRFATGTSEPQIPAPARRGTRSP